MTVTCAKGDMESEKGLMGAAYEEGWPCWLNIRGGRLELMRRMLVKEQKRGAVATGT